MAKGISLDKFAKGALKAQFNRELQKVTANVLDPNTSAKAKRTITITVSISPDDDREMGGVVIATKSTLCPVNAVNTKLVFGYDEVDREGVASELNAEMLGQVDMEEMEAEIQRRNAESEAEAAEKVIDLRGAK